MSEQNSANAWVVRAGAHGEAEESNFALSRASIGWSEFPDLSTVTSREELRSIIATLTPVASTQQIGQATGQIWSFRDRIKPGDLVVMPLKLQPDKIAFGRCAGSYGYDADAPDVSKHYLPVQWQPEPVSREKLQPDLLAIVNGAMTVFAAANYDAAARLALVADGESDPGFGGVSGGENEPVRRGLLIRTALEVLDQAGGPRSRLSVMHDVEARIELTDYERERVGASEVPRWQTQLAWSSTDMRAAGWITKDNPGWQITDAGREALADAADDGAKLDVLVATIYRQQHAAKKQPTVPHYAPILEAAVGYLEPGQWSTYSDLAAVANTNAQTVGSFVSSVDVEGTHRVLGKGGRPSPGFTWSNGRSDTQREALEMEGIHFDDSGAASEAQYVRAGDLRAFLEEKGVIVPPPRRAWLVRGSAVDGRDLIPRWLRDGFISLRAATLREVEAGVSWDQLKLIVDEDYSQSS